MTQSKQSVSKGLFEEAKQSLVGGVNSPVRAYKSVQGDPVFIQSGKGATITSEDGVDYVDYVLSYGPLLFGHAHPDIVSALDTAIQLGTSFGAPTRLETTLAEKIKGHYPYVDKVRFVNSGTEASMSAIRLARGVTNRSVIVKFKGCYHGHTDSLLVSAGSGAATLGVPDSAGVTAGSVADTATLDYNNSEQCLSFFKEHGDRVAAVILEPVAGNMGLILPEQDFIQTVRTCCNTYNSLLIFDEVMCGFRSQKGGSHTWLNCEPDIVVLGKVIGGGLPCGAYAAKSSIMDHLAPLGPVYQAGTLSGNPLAMAAGVATLSLFESSSLFDQAAQYTEALAHEINALFKSKDKPYFVQVKGTMFCIFFSQGPIRSYTDVSKCDFDAFNSFFHCMLDQHIYLPPSQYETCFTSTCHNDLTLKSTIEAVRSWLQ